MPTAKRRFFKRHKHPVGNSSEKPREKEVIRRIAQVAKSTVEARQPHHKKEEFPKISQFISETRSKGKQISKSFSESFPRLSTKSWVLFGIMILLIAVIVWQIGIVIVDTRNFLYALGQRTKLQNEITLWENISTKYPTYRDAAFKVALFAYQLGDKQKENTYLEKTLQIDPNYVYARNLEKLVQ